MTRIDPDAIRKGNRLALSRALTAIENNDPAGQAALAALFPETGKAHLVGVTGSPGTGKSTLVNQLARCFRQSPNTNPPKVGIIAVDPSSPFTGGALLGDRIRMQDLVGDPEIFIRSMASRGALGGLSHSTAAFATLMDGAGFDLIFIETVGAGQAEVDIAQLAHTVIVVEAPGLGDDIQAIKAGILEIADILAVNKADLPGSENAARALRMMLDMAHGKGSLPTAGKHFRSGFNVKKEVEQVQTQTWEPPVQLITATDGKGIPKLAEAIQSHKSYLKSTGLWQVKEAYRLQKDLEALVRDTLMDNWREKLDDDRFRSILEDLIHHKLSPAEALQLLL
jgi:LAO/AO transport system kinase